MVLNHHDDWSFAAGGKEKRVLLHGLKRMMAEEDASAGAALGTPGAVGLGSPSHAITWESGGAGADDAMLAQEPSFCILL